MIQLVYCDNNESTFQQVWYKFPWEWISKREKCGSVGDLQTKQSLQLLSLSI